MACGGTTRHFALDSSAIHPAFFASLIALLTDAAERGAPGVPRISAISPGWKLAWPFRRWHPKASDATRIHRGIAGLAARLAARSRQTA
ncbi:hypothetical protein AWC11_03340 [Mycobacterium interjectum]|nr:hypothetical protein AWC11_03340 [Mycobacterium interjectum]